MYDQHGEFESSAFVARDITDRKHLQEELRASEERLRLITDRIPDMVTQNDAEGLVTFVNPALQTVLGYEPEALLGNPGMALIHPDDLGSLMEIASAGRAANAPSMRAEVRLRHADGHYLWAETTGTYIYDTQSRYLGAIYITRDVTERKRLQEDLRANEERLRLITNNVPDLISQLDEMGCYTYASPSFQTALGYDPAALIGTRGVEMIHPEDVERMTALYQEAITTRPREMQAELRLRHIDGHYIWVESTGAYLYDEAGNYKGGVFVARDINERKRLQEALIEQEKLTTALEKEQELNQLKNRMMLRIDHEFRTPLTVIRSMAYTLDAYADRLGAEQRGLKVDAIQRQVERIVLMLDAIRSVLTGTYADQRTNRLPVRLLDLCRAAIRDIEAHFGTSGRLLMNVPEDLLVDVDPQALKEAIYKIIVNALLYSSPPDLVHVTAEPIDGEVELRVIDCGIGILENEQPRIFEPFFRGSNIGEVSGIGLGLTIAKASVESYGGRIEIDSDPNKGTTVRLRLLAAE
ncbi:MAG: PAS domain-containing sensor histidine kinase [Anaerolineae bacterium]|nr:PAS domain-containing sensor histidine kinase [Anaerolineae bacterium]